MTASKRAREITVLQKLLNDPEIGNVLIADAIKKLHAIALRPPQPKKRKLKWGPDAHRVFYAESMERRKAGESIDDLVARMRDVLEKHGLELKPRPAAEQKMDLKAKSLQRRFYAGKAEMRKVLREFLGDDAKLDEELAEEAKSVRDSTSSIPG